MANTGFRGVDVREEGGKIIIRAVLYDSTGALVTSGSAYFYLSELQDDGTFKSYDFDATVHGFKTTALTTETQGLTHRSGNNGTTPMGEWTYAIASNLTDFTPDGIYHVRVHHDNAFPTDQYREFQYGGAGEGSPIYHADIQFTRDQANTKDEYTIAWFRDGKLVTTGITSPVIQIIKRVDGTDLVASTALTQVGTTGIYKYDESTNRQTVGEAVIVLVNATIGGSSRPFYKLIGRDSS